MKVFEETLYVNIDDPVLLNASLVVKKSVAETSYVIALFRLYPDNKHYVVVQYVYCEHLDSLFRIIGTPKSIVIEKLAATVDEAERLCKVYQRYFVEFDPTTYDSVKKEEFEAFGNHWKQLFDFFIPEVSFLIQPGRSVNILMTLSSIRGKEYVLDFGAIFDLQFQFRDMKENLDCYVLSVAAINIVEFAKKLVGLFRPVPERTIILYGFDKHYTEKAITEQSEHLRTLALVREKLYDCVLTNAQAAGVTITHLEDKENLLKYFRTGWEGHFIHLLAHYESRDDYKRLFLKQRSVRFDILEKWIDNMIANNEWRQDIILDAVTCTNFFDFRSLYTKSIRYLCLSHHDFDTDQAAYVLNEMYSGINARRISWKFPYLDGNTHFHEARSNVHRCFFTSTQRGFSILTP